MAKQAGASEAHRQGGTVCRIEKTALSGRDETGLSRRSGVKGASTREIICDDLPVMNHLLEKRATPDRF